MRKLAILLSLVSVFTCPVMGQERSETFIVRNFEGHVQVLAPRKMYDKQSVIIENRTLEKLIGKIVTPDHKHVKHIAVEAKKSKSLSMPGKGHRRLIFIPLSPAFQSVELKVGMDSYEIPAKR